MGFIVNRNETEKVFLRQIKIFGQLFISEDKLLLLSEHKTA